MRKLFYLFIFFFSGLISINARNSITVAVATNASYALKKIKKAFPEKINLVFASSGKLSFQIKQGAPYHVFLSANKEYPERLFKQGHTLNRPIVYARGKLIIWSKKYKIGPVPVRSLLSKFPIRNIAIANPRFAPYGKAAIESLNYYQIWQSFKDKLIYASSVSGVNHYVDSKNCDIGFASASRLYENSSVNHKNYIELDKKSYRPLQQAIVILKFARVNSYQQTKRFYNFILSPKARKIFLQSGFMLP